MLCCKECGGNNIGWDAWVDEEGAVISTFDHYMCLDCDGENPELVREKESNNEN